MTALVVLEGVVIALLAVLVVGLLRSHAEILRRLHDLGAGAFDEADPAATASTAATAASGAPEIRTRPGVPEPRAVVTAAADVAGTTPDGTAAVVGVVGAPHTTLLAFLTSGCGTCANFWSAFGAGEADPLPGRDTRLVIVTAGTEKESPAAVHAVAPAGHTTVMSSQAWSDYAVPMAPYFILVDGPSGRVVGEGAASSWPQVAELITKAVADAGITPGGGAVRSERPAGRLDGSERAERARRELAAAGIEPGHASLYPDAVGGEERAGRDVEGPPADTGGVR